MLQINDLDVYYGRIQTLRSITLNVDKGELVSIIGSNGAGKTTLLLAISGLITSSSGTIEFLGSRIDKLPSHKIVRLGLCQVAQGRMLFPEMTVLENLEMGAISDTNVKEMLEEIYAYFPVLSERNAQKASTLSGGEQQMLAIGRALMSKPKLLLLDEPTTGLSPLLTQKVVDITRKLYKAGLDILLVEQNASVAMAMADRVYLLQSGRLVGSGTPPELMESDHVRKVYLGLA